MNNTTKTCILAEASRKDKNYNFFGSLVPYEGKLYWVDLSTERVEFRRNLEEKDENRQ